MLFMKRFGNLGGRLLQRLAHLPGSSLTIAAGAGGSADTLSTATLQPGPWRWYFEIDSPGSTIG
jgi:hypothetical protein